MLPVLEELIMNCLLLQMAAGDLVPPYNNGNIDSKQW